MALAAEDAALANASVQADFYANLCRLRDDVLARRHARIRLSTPALEELSRATATHQGADAVASPSLTNGVASQPGANLFAATSAPTITPVKPVAVLDPTVRTSSDELVKAETAAADERRTKQRRQIEARFKEQCQAQKKRMAVESLFRKKDPNCLYYDEPHNFDTTKVLEQALQLVKPISGLATAKPDAPISPASSFDENQYYSSQVNSLDSKSEGEVSPPRPPIPSGPKGYIPRFDTAPNNEKHSVYGATRSGAAYQAPEIISADGSNSREESYSPPAPDAFARPENPQVAYQQPNLHHAPSAFGVSPIVPPPQFALPTPYTFSSTFNGHEAESEGSYSPPAQPATARLPKAAPSEPKQPTSKKRKSQNGGMSNKQQVAGKNAKQQKGPAGKQNQDAKKQKTSNGESAPLSKKEKRALQEQSSKQARQAAHAAEMAQAAEAARVQQVTFAAQNALSRSQGSTAMASIALDNPRKRRRNTQGDTDGQNQQASGAKRIARQYDAASPMPFIKHEPASPPPFSNLPPSNEPSRELKLRADGRAELVEVDSPQRRQHAYARPREVPIQLQYMESDDEMASPRYVDRPQQVYADHPIRTPTYARRSGYESGDLRRVASYQHAMRPASPEMAPPRLQRAPEDVRYVRAPSRIVSDRPLSAYQPYFDDDVQQVSAYRPVQRPAPTYIDLDPEEAPKSARSATHTMHPPMPMGPPAPPRQRVYRDEYGEEWIAIPAPRRTMAAPEAMYESRPAIRYVDAPQPMFEPRQASRSLSMASAPYQRQAAPNEYEDVYRVAAPSRAYSTRPGTAVQPVYVDDDGYDSSQARQPRHSRQW